MALSNQTGAMVVSTGNKPTWKLDITWAQNSSHIGAKKYLWDWMNEQIEKRLRLKSDAELLAVIESNEGDYTKQAIEVAQRVLTQRSLDQAKVLELARNLMKTKILSYLKSFDVINDTFVLPQSSILTEEEIKSLFSQTFTQWKNEQDGMIPDGWQYVLAAGLG